MKSDSNTKFDFSPLSTGDELCQLFDRKPTTQLQNGEPTMQIVEIIGDVSQAKHELATLTDLDPARLKLCTTAIHHLEEILEELITLRWVPRTMAGINGAIASVMNNIRKTEQLIDGRLDEIWNGQVPDEVLRMNITLIVLDALKFQFSALIEARLHVPRSTLEEIESEFVN
jgi:hypothetical protein